MSSSPQPSRFREDGLVTAMDREDRVPQSPPELPSMQSKRKRYVSNHATRYCFYPHINRRSSSASPHARSPSPPLRRPRSQSPPTATVETSTSVTVAPSAQTEFAKLLGSRSGGAYIPPARLRALQQEAAKDKNSAEYQRLSWDALRKSINGLINKVSLCLAPRCTAYSQVNVSNIKHVVPELFGENLIRGKGLFARSIMRAQAASLPFTPIFAALVAIINTKLPQVGELVLIRLISQFRRAYKRNDKVRRLFVILLTAGCLSCNVHLHCPSVQPICSTRDCRIANFALVFGEADRRFYRDCSRIYA